MTMQSYWTLPQPPIHAPAGSKEWVRWFHLVHRRLGESLELLWSKLALGQPLLDGRVPLRHDELSGVLSVDAALDAPLEGRHLSHAQWQNAQSRLVAQEEALGEIHDGLALTQGQLQVQQAGLVALEVRIGTTETRADGQETRLVMVEGHAQADNPHPGSASTTELAAHVALSHAHGAQGPLVGRDDMATAQQAGVVRRAAAVSDVALVVSNPPAQSEVQALADRLDALLSALREAGLVSP
ncbi:MAG: hypothetical protein H7831_13135 [Magnetococcus sp. WYHC-3]